jgi:hypothetical protein
MTPTGHLATARITKRRQMTKGQMAMIAAMGLCLETKQRGDDTQAAKSAGVSKARLSQAITVREHAPHLAQEVIGGEVMLDAAYKRPRDGQEKTLILTGEF